MISPSTTTSFNEGKDLTRILSFQKRKGPPANRWAQYCSFSVSQQKARLITLKVKIDRNHEEHADADQHIVKRTHNYSFKSLSDFNALVALVRPNEHIIIKTRPNITTFREALNKA